MRIAWLAPYPVQYLTPTLKLGRHVPVSHSHPCSWIVNLARPLSQRPDVELHLLTESPLVTRSQIVTDQNIVYHVQKCGVPFLHRGFPSFMQLDVWTGFSANIRRFAAELRRIQPDLVHAHGTEGACALAAHHSGFPCLISMQGIVTEVYKTAPCLRFRVVRRYEQETVRRARYFACRTTFDSGFVRSMNPDARIFTIHEAMNPVYFQNEWQVRDTDTLLYVGSLVSYKGLDVLLEALQLVLQKRPKVMLGVIGSGKRSVYIELCERLRIAGHVEFLGFQSADQIARHHLESQVFVLPSRNDNSPNALAEAMVSGMPVIATNVGGVSSMVTDGETGLLVSPRDPAKLAEGILQLLENPAERARMGKNAQRVARQRHDPEQVATETLNAYREILNSSDYPASI
jgi:glycosyltransferase involved in cell wall biosynthesis